MALKTGPLRNGGEPARENYIVSRLCDMNNSEMRFSRLEWPPSGVAAKLRDATLRAPTLALYLQENSFSSL